MTDLLREFRLLVCGWCFSLAVKMAPKDDLEGIIIIEAVCNWALRSIASLKIKDKNHVR